MTADDEGEGGRPRASRGPLTDAELAAKYGWDEGDVEVMDADGGIVKRAGKKSADVDPVVAPADDPHA